MVLITSIFDLGHCQNLEASIGIYIKDRLFHTYTTSL